MSAIRPPGRRTRAISRSAGPWSNQWNAWAAVTTSALASGSGIASAPPSTATTAGYGGPKMREHLGERLDCGHPVPERDEGAGQLARPGAEIDDVERRGTDEPANGLVGISGS